LYGKHENCPLLKGYFVYIKDKKQECLMRQEFTTHVKTGLIKNKNNKIGHLTLVEA
jgi:hypothetical protein